MSDSGIDRRQFLRGAAGTTLALPFLEAGLSVTGEDKRARAAGSNSSGPDEPLYYIVCFCGSATGSNGDIQSAPVGANAVPEGPNATGSNYPLTKPALEPLSRKIKVHGRQGKVPAQEYVSLLSGLSMPPASSPNNNDPGSRVTYDNPGFHRYQVGPLLSGVSSEKTNVGRDRFRSGTSSDQVLAQHWGQKQTFAGRVQADVYGGYPGLKKWHTPLSTIQQSDGSVDIIEPLVDPKRAFSQWVGSKDKKVQATRRELLMSSSDRSLLDGVLSEFKELKGDSRLSYRDQQRLQRHADEVRALEKKIEELKNRTTCNGQFPANTWKSRTNRNQKTGVNDGWMYEDLRAELMTDTMVRAMACGQTNIGTLCYSVESSNMNIRYLGNQSKGGSIHGVNHSDNWSPLAGHWVINWHVDHWVNLLERLAAEPAPPPHHNESMLDRSAVVLLFESGAKPGGSNPVKTHTTDEMLALIGGRAGANGKRLKGNVHKHAGNNAHPVTAQMTAMEALGVQQNKLGEVPWNSHSELFEQT